MANAFREKRDARASRQTKSYVSQSSLVHLANPTAALVEPVRNSVETSSITVNDTQTISDGADAMSQKFPVNLASRGWYAELPPTLVIKRSKKRGRGLWTKHAIKAGTVLFSLRPRVHVLSTAHLSSYCMNCCLPRLEGGLKKCTVCRAVFYCGPPCQKADWTMHKLECEAILRWASAAPPSASVGSRAGVGDEDNISIPGEAVRCLARLLWRRRKEGSENIWWKEIDDMQSHRNSLPPSMTDSHVHLAHALVRYLGIDGPEELSKFHIRGVGDLVDLISKFTCNTFTLTTPSLSPIGVSVSPLAALINHSCDPNTAIVFPRPEKLPKGVSEPVLQAVAIRDVPAGVELFTSYVDITLPTSQRQKSLKETYNFTCECSTCTAGNISGTIDAPLQHKSWQDPREVVQCPESCGGVCPLPPTDDSESRCVKCNTRLTNVGDIVDAVRIGQDALDKAMALQFTDPEDALLLTSRVIPLLTHLNVSPSTHPLLALQRLHQSLIISSLNLPVEMLSPTPTTTTMSCTSPEQKAAQARLDDAIRAAYASLLGLKDILRPGHPVRAIALAELGKLLAVDEPAPPFNGPDGQPISASSLPSGSARLKQALATLQQAYSELLIAFGTENGGGAIGNELRDLIVRIEKELGVWASGVRNVIMDAVEARKAR